MFHGEPMDSMGGRVANSLNMDFQKHDMENAMLVLQVQPIDEKKRLGFGQLILSGCGFNSMPCDKISVNVGILPKYA